MTPLTILLGMWCVTYVAMLGVFLLASMAAVDRGVVA
jgi:hypothetical protein